MTGTCVVDWWKRYNRLRFVATELLRLSISFGALYIDVEAPFHEAIK